MITKLESIKNFGIFRDFSNSNNLQDFKKYNLIYGWNGSGKSTFSKLFDCLKSKNVEETFGNGSFRFKIEDGSFLDSKKPINYPDSLKIEVFNKNFVDVNIDWDNITKKLLYISKERVEDKKTLANLNEDLRNLEIDINKKENKINKTESEIDNFLITGAKEIKTEFKILSTDDTYYLNYDKRRLKSLIENKTSAVKKIKLIAKANELDGLKLTARLEYLDKIDVQLPSKIKTIELIEIQEKANALLNKNILTNVISSLKRNSRVSLWVEEGISLHGTSHKCKFCENIISEDRVEELNSHFNEDYINLKKNIKKVIERFILFKSKVEDEILLDIEIYPFLRDRFFKQISSLRSCKSELESMLDISIIQLNSKYENPFVDKLKKINFSNEILNKYNAIIDNIDEIIVNHNETSDGFDEYVNKAKNKLELSIAQKEVKKFKYFSKVRSKKALEKTLKVLQNKEPILRKKIEILDASLNNEILGAEEFNNKLHRFLNHNDISLKFDSNKNGYEILRKVGRKKEKGINLSEGEKTAISFVYFLTKLLEKEGEIKETIVVIDDPISSFDSNHLFNAYSFINNICNDSKQLFVLTHNFTFYRLVRDWMLRKSKLKTNPADGIKYLDKKYSVYNITSNYKNGVRQSILEDADKTLLLYSTEYHYLFMKLNTFVNQSKLSVEQCFSVANMSRKLLEIFLNFKFPKKRNDFAQLLNFALPKEPDLIMRERVYRFINKYSHSDHIEAFDNSIDNILSESDNIAKDVMKIIKKLDKKHFEELIEIVNE